jgi:type IV pilus assembly protein PilN
MIRINLLPVRAAQKKQKLRTQMSILFLCAVLACVACAGLYIQKKAAVNGVKADIADIDRQNLDLKKKIGQVKDFENKKADLEKKLTVLETLKENKSGPVHLLEELSLALPERLWVTTFAEKDGSIDISGVADSENTVAEFMESLETSPYYRGIKLAVTEQTMIANMKMQKFSLKCSAEKPAADRKQDI